MSDVVKVDLTTGIGTLSFPHLFLQTKSTNDKGEDVYDVQIIIPKSQRDDLRAILSAIKQVGESKWGANWKKVRNPLRDGDKEADELAEDGSTKAQKYPERLGCYFLNARSTKPVTVVDRQLNVINNPDEVYGGCKGKISVTFYAYSTQGNHGVAAGLNGVQKVADGEAFGGGRPSVESMFDMLDDDDEFEGLEDEADEVEEIEEPEPPKKRTTAKKAAAAPAKKAAAKKTTAKKTAAKKAAEPEPDDLDEFEGEEDEDDLFDDLDD